MLSSKDDKIINSQQGAKRGYAVKFAVVFLLWTLLFTAGVVRSAESPLQLACPDCNIILVSLDTLRADALGAYGYSRNTSPNLDRLASGGMVFLNTWSQACHTLPSHMSIFTSQYPWTHRVRVPIRDQLAPDTLTLPMALKKGGYHTVWAGPLQHPPLHLKAGFDRGFDEFFYPGFNTIGGVNNDKEWGPAYQWLDTNKNKKFFMFLHTYRVHDPYPRENRFPLPAARSGDTTLEELDSLITENFDDNKRIAAFRQALKDNPVIFTMSDPRAKRLALLDLMGKTGADTHFMLRIGVIEKLCGNSPGDLASFRAAYDVGVFEADLMVGRLYAQLKKLGLDKKTLLVITADHGEEFMEHGRLWHHQLYTEQLHVPLIFVFPGRHQAQRLTRLVQSIDIAPTILDAAGLPAIPGAEGSSLLPLLEGGALAAAQSDAMAFAEWQGDYSVRDDSYTYIVRHNCKNQYLLREAACQSEELYDRVADPGELHNIFPANAEAAAGLAGRLARKLESAVKAPLLPWPAGIPEEIRRRLLNTGYW